MADQSHRVSAIAELIENKLDSIEGETGVRLTDAAFARRGTDLTRGNIGSYRKRRYDRPIEPEKRAGLALALDVNQATVERAMAEDVGLEIHVTFDYDYRTDPQLTSRDRDEIERLITEIKSRPHRYGRTKPNG